MLTSSRRTSSRRRCGLSWSARRWCYTDARDRLKVERALAAATKARDWAGQFASWWENEIYTAAIAKMVEEVGDALASVSQGMVSAELQAAYPKFPWDFVRRIRVTLAHNYGAVNVPALRRTVERDIPRWIDQLAAMLRDDGP